MRTGTVVKAMLCLAVMVGATFATSEYNISKTIKLIGYSYEEWGIFSLAEGYAANPAPMYNLIFVDCTTEMGRAKWATVLAIKANGMKVASIEYETPSGTNISKLIQITAE